MGTIPQRIKHFRRDLNQWSLYAVALSLFIAIPIFAIVINLFGGTGEMWSHIVTYFLLDYIGNSVLLIIGTGILCVLMGVSSAWIVTKYEFPFRQPLEWALFLPLAIPSYIVAYAYVGMLGNGGSLMRLLQTWGIGIQKIEMMNLAGLVWVLSVSLFPYVYASTKAMFGSQPHALRDSAYLLGASERKYFYRIALPLALPAIIGGLFLVFMEVLNDYGAAKYYGINTFTTGIFRTWTALEDLESAIYLSALLVVLVFILMGLVRLQRGRKSYSFKVKEQQGQKARRVSLEGRKKILYPILVFLPVLFGFVLPLGQLLYWAVLTFEAMFNLELLWITLQSFGVAFSAAFLVIICAVASVYFAKWSNLRGFALFTKVATIGYVIPGAIIGIGIISSSQFIINFFDNSFGLKIGFLFYGSSVVLVYAYIFRFLAVAYNPIEANSLKLGKSLSEAAYLLRKKRLSTLFSIELPLLKATLISAFLLVFIDTLKELPLTLILKPYDLNTLAVSAYAYADDERVPEAALPALMLIGTVVLVLFFVNYKRKR
ncbi:MAG: iron ABC transporter permease [Bacteroidota bacterium]